MGFFIFLLFALVWLSGSFALSWRLFRSSQRLRWVKRFTVGAFIAILPFAEELYITNSFRLYCAEYGGIQSLNSVKTDRLEISGRETWNGLKMLAIGTIEAVRVVEGQNPKTEVEKYWLSLSASEVCDDPVHLMLVNQEVHYARVYPRKLEAKGQCVSGKPFSPNPQFKLFESEEVAHQPLTPFMLTDMRERRLGLQSKATGEVLSELVFLAAAPGKILRTFVPYFKYHRCPSSRLPGDKDEFPFAFLKYQFLAQAVSGDS